MKIKIHSPFKGICNPRWHSIIPAFLILLFSSCNHPTTEEVIYHDTLPIPAEGYVTLDGSNFAIDGKTWFPLMLNYKAEIRHVGDSLEVVPASYYHVNDFSGTPTSPWANIRTHFDTIASWHFNSIRLCLDVLDSDMDSAAMFRATRRVIQQADSAGLRVMLLIKPPLDPYWQNYTQGLLRTLADLPALWAYDFMNEPLYFDPEPERDKMDAVRLVSLWRHWVRQYAPHQLFTVATAEPIEVFEWDPSILPVDFIEMHTYHPLRVFSEMWWYSHYCNKPWMVGETGLPADNDSVPYNWQFAFMFETYRFAKINGAAGFGWWEFQDCPEGVNFEAQYTGLRDKQGVRKPAVDMVSMIGYVCLGVGADEDSKPPFNYHNMLGYNNIRLTGKVIDKESGLPIEGAVIRGWNEDWSVGMNTYSDSNGHFTLYSNDYNTHFEISAPSMSRVKFNRKNLKYKNIGNVDPNNLPNRSLEYQQIDYRPYLWLEPDGSLIGFLKHDTNQFNKFSLTSDLGLIKLEKLTIK